MFGGYGLRGVVRDWKSEAGRYTIEFEGGSNVFQGQIHSGSVDVRKALLYIDQSNKALYPSDALPFDSSVRCVIDSNLRGKLSFTKHADAECICGIIEGVAVDHSNVAIYYNIGPNISTKQYFLAEDVSLVVKVPLPQPAEASAAVTDEPPSEKAEVVVIESNSSSSEFEDPQPPVSKAPGVAKGKGGVGSKKDEGKAPATFRALSTTARPPAAQPQHAVRKEAHWEESDSEEGAGGAEVVQWNRSALVYYYGVGQEHAGTVTGRCVNHETRLASKYTIQTQNRSFTRVRAQDVYWPSRVTGDSSKPVVDAPGAGGQAQRQPGVARKTAAPKASRRSR